MFERFRNFAAGAAVALAAAVPAQSATVDVVLSLLIDVSGSVDASEYGLQRTGYVNAFNDASIIAAITDTSNGKVGAIAVNVIQFGTNAAEAIAMTIIDSAATAQAFATTLNAMTRIQSGSTGIGQGIDAAEASIVAWLAAGNTASRKVIDVSGDGPNNTGTSPLNASASFCGAGGTINGISIGTASLKTYYETNVACGGGFVLSASTFADFDQAIRTKLKAEISGEDPNGPPPVPLPAAGWLMIAGLGALAAARRRKA